MSSANGTKPNTREWAQGVLFNQTSARFRASVVRRDPQDGSTVTRYEYIGAAPVIFLKLQGAGHSVPTTHRRLWAEAGTNRDIDGLPMAMDFLLQFRRVGDRFVRIM